MRILHYVDHYPKGTIYRLVEPLTRFAEHVLVYAPEKKSSHEEIAKLFTRENSALVVHSTGRLADWLLSISESTCTIPVYLFLHVSPNYMSFRGRTTSMGLLVDLFQRGVRFLSPSRAIQKQLIELGIESHVIQIGIPRIESQLGLESARMTHFYNRIITCCTKNSMDYRFAKGIDIFIEFVREKGLQKQALIVGCNMGLQDIESVCLPHNAFMQVLSKAKVYLQYSRFEAYNVTAIEAKQLKVPVIALQSEGIDDNILFGGVFSDVRDMNEQVMHIIKGEYDPSIIQKNYQDSSSRETISSFAYSLRKIVGG